MDYPFRELEVLLSEKLRLRLNPSSSGLPIPGGAKRIERCTRLSVLIPLLVDYPFRALSPQLGLWKRLKGLNPSSSGLPIPGGKTRK